MALHSLNSQVGVLVAKTMTMTSCFNNCNVVSLVIFFHLDARDGYTGIISY